MRPNFFVFCEGPTEIAYVKFLRSLYRLPIQVIPKKGEANISKEMIDNSRRDYVQTSQDKVFLMFDLDIKGLLERLQKIPDAVLLVSNPCIELWFLLHYKDVNADLSSKTCIQRLSSITKGYKKGTLSVEEKKTLSDNRAIAIERACKMSEYKNPSTTIYRLLLALDDIANPYKGQ